MRLHVLDPLRPLLHLARRDLALPHALHDREALARVHSLLNQVHHDVVAAADRRLKRRGVRLDQHLRISLPHVRPVRESRDPDQVRESLRLRLEHHVHGEIRSELRNAERPEPAAHDLLRGDAERGGVLKQAHDLL